jgi:HD-GYP domain-containing protein (c-di-GMP phosphodiesterase class II)
MQDPPKLDGHELEALRRRNAKLQALLDIGKALSAERNVDKLLAQILEAAKLVVEADRCTLFILDDEKQELWSKIAHGTTGELRLPLDRGVAGLCARTASVVNIANPYDDLRFNGDVDRVTGYRTRNILAVPMIDVEGRCTGVLQALNRGSGDAFTREDEEFLLALGASAAAAVENALLHRDIERLFDGFVKASVYAIEARDPTTSGHSERVARLTIASAEALMQRPTPTWRDVRFTTAELRELRYAALLHDFGKVGVREDVLIKANKLHPHELVILRERFHHARSRVEVSFLVEENEALKAQGLHGDACEVCAGIQARKGAALKELDELWTFIEQCNRPTVLEQGGFERLQDIARRAVDDGRGGTLALLTDEERMDLSIPRGSLNAAERVEIESHVTHTYHFLRQIPWTRDLRRVPEIAFKHHEKLSGDGYPRKLAPVDIPVQARLMTIADIYDALTAKDRPYKKALPHEKALDILHADAKKGALDAELLTVFVEAQVHETLLDISSSMEGEACDI